MEIQKSYNHDFILLGIYELPRKVKLASQDHLLSSLLIRLFYICGEVLQEL